MFVALLLLAPKSPDAWELLQQSISAYRSLKSYSDEGFSTVRGPNGPENFPLKAKYVKGKGAVVEWETKGESETVWSSKGEIFRLVESKYPPKSSKRQIVVHLNRMPTSKAYPGIVNPDEAGTRWVCNLLTSNLSDFPGLDTRDRSQWRVLTADKVDGAKCDVIGVGETKLFLDAKSHLVRRIEGRYNGATPVAIQVKPKANSRVSDRDVDFQPPTYKYDRMAAPKDKPETYAGASHGFKTYDDIVQTVSEHYLHDNLEDEFATISDGFAGRFSSGRHHLLRRSDGAFSLTSSRPPSEGTSTLWSNGVETQQWSLHNNQDVSLYWIDRQETAEGAARRTYLDNFTNWPVAAYRTMQAQIRFDTLSSTFTVSRTTYEGKRAFEVRATRNLRPSVGGGKDVTESLRWLVGNDGLPILEEWREGSNWNTEPFFSIRHNARLVPRPKWNQIEFRPPTIDLVNTLRRWVAIKQD